MVIGVSIISIAAMEPNLPFLHIVFESFSAYSTVGLSMGITTELSSISKFILLFVMFIGRVSLSILIALFKQVKFSNYQHPKKKF